MIIITGGAGFIGSNEVVLHDGACADTMEYDGKYQSYT